MKDKDTNYWEHVSLEKFLKDGDEFKANTRPDDISYIEFLRYFNDIDVITKHNLVIGINFTYGWMPTIFEFRSNNFDEAIEILNKAKKGTIPTLDQIKVLKGLLNNSLVGTSKLLHFINPQIFAIWDSRVYRYLTGKEPYDNRIGNAEAYLLYLNFCKYLTSEHAYDKVHASIIKKVGFSMTKFRTAELIMYINGAK